MINKIKNKIKDFFDVIKYKKQRNTALNKYEARNSDYITALETIQTLVIQNMDFQRQIDKLKQEKKELKKIVEEEIVVKKNRKK